MIGISPVSRSEAVSCWRCVSQYVKVKTTRSGATWMAIQRADAAETVRRWQKGKVQDARDGDAAR
jgi:hypothetical protein